MRRIRRRLYRSTQLVRSGGALVTVAEPPRVRREDTRSDFFVVESGRNQLTGLERRLRDGRLQLLIGAIAPLAQASAAFDLAHRVPGKTIIEVNIGA
ncbi:NADPH:quinone reductase-like Zn-dependent oxidoreductase [Mycobacterium frederiksbergense]|uniref:NADPH:quinone reductase-like Zn-dependent oxidoreductase n=1 Tax=Mycolicibacterium frederiksbergense TaxID=117567 RepID=A0ABT6KZC4_9MYCO|nr:hypothetical protein [Mycolicibacterium frederiksbergense]MDH6196044.1 NADPH:quinone reductase-like Zn-dependent oxidoreductase [Mycolicibacterium frederiksbergense]